MRERVAGSVRISCSRVGLWQFTRGSTATPRSFAQLVTSGSSLPTIELSAAQSK